MAAGQGKRLRPLTYKIPKGMLEVTGKKIIEHNILALPAEIEEVIIVIGHLGDKIKKYFKNNFAEKKIRYIKQDKLLGTAHALSKCRKILKKRFLVLMGDNIYFKDDIIKCLKHSRCILVKKEKGHFQSVLKNRRGNFIGLRPVEKKGLMNTGLYILDGNFFKYSMVKLLDGEFGLPQTMATNVTHYKIKVVVANQWLQINTHDDLKRAEDNLK